MSSSIILVITRIYVSNIPSWNFFIDSYLVCCRTITVFLLQEIIWWMRTLRFWSLWPRRCCWMDATIRGARENGDNVWLREVAHINVFWNWRTAESWSMVIGRTFWGWQLFWRRIGWWWYAFNWLPWLGNVGWSKRWHKQSVMWTRFFHASTRWEIW